MDKTVFFTGEYTIILVKSVCHGPFIVAIYEVFILCKVMVKFKCTLLQALRLCTGRTAHRGVDV